MPISFVFFHYGEELRDIDYLSVIRRFRNRTELNVIWMSHYLCPDLKSDCLPQVFHFSSFEDLLKNKVKEEKRFKKETKKSRLPGRIGSRDIIIKE